MTNYKWTAREKELEGNDDQSTEKTEFHSVTTKEERQYH